MSTVRIALPTHLRTLAGVDDEVRLDVAEPPTLGGALSALEERYPMLRGTIRDAQTEKRRAFIRFFAGGRDVSNEQPDSLLPDAVVAGEDVLCVVGAIAGG